MMMVCPWFQREIIIEDGKITTLVIENQPLFRRFAEELGKQIVGDNGEIVLSEHYTPQDLKNSAEILDRFAPFELNKKQLLNKITAKLEKTALDEVHYMQAKKLLWEIEQFAEEVAFEYSCDLVYDKIDIGVIFKAIGIRLADEYAEPLERILDYMSLVREFERNKIFIMINMRSYFDDAAMNLFAQTVKKQQFAVLLLESTERKRLSDELCYVIDEDLCEI